jgi:hypothetical protein
MVVKNLVHICEDVDTTTSKKKLKATLYAIE